MRLVALIASIAIAGVFSSPFKESTTPGQKTTWRYEGPVKLVRVLPNQEVLVKVNGTLHKVAYTGTPNQQMKGVLLHGFQSKFNE